MIEERLYAYKSVRGYLPCKILIFATAFPKPNSAYAETKNSRKSEQPSVDYTVTNIEKASSLALCSSVPSNAITAASSIQSTQSEMTRS